MNNQNNPSSHLGLGAASPSPGAGLSLSGTLGSAQFLFTQRFHAEGASIAPFEEFNLATHVGDSSQAVVHNRQVLCTRLGAEAVFLNQVHGTRAVCLDDHAPGSHLSFLHEADASFTTRPGIACTVLVADCLPVLFSLNHGQVVGAAHAGWRGLAAGVLENTIEHMRRSLAVLQAQPVAPTESSWKGYPRPKHPAEHLTAWLGPCIGPRVFEVGQEVYDAFIQQNKLFQSCFFPLNRAAGKYLASLPALARLRLALLGVQDIRGNNDAPLWCTFSNPELFFSYRRAIRQGPSEHKGKTGRMAACIWKN